MEENDGDEQLEKQEEKWGLRRRIEHRFVTFGTKV
jgi:hypothetical protein